MKKITKKYLTSLALLMLIGFIFSMMAPSALAADIFEQASSGAKKIIEKAYGYSVGDIDPNRPETNPFLHGMFTIINALLTFIAVIFFLILIYAGYLWMMARGREEQIEKAKKMTREVVIGLIIILLARLLTEFILTQVGKIIPQ